ncbi:hypothetical protein PENTCL1PPCAC_21778, partial [Pristionchus entomophagus]
MKNDVKMKSEDIENLKLLTSQRGKASRKLESEVQLKSKEIEYLKKSEAEWKTQLSEMRNEVKSKSVEIDNLKMRISQDVRKILEKVETNSIDLRNLHDKKTEMTIRARFTEISKLKSIHTFSQLTEFSGLNWRIILCKNDDHLSFYVEAQNKNADIWSCLAFRDCQLISQTDENIVHIMNSQMATVFTTNGEYPIWGLGKFISFKVSFHY